jgi:hypothetical protein
LYANLCCSSIRSHSISPPHNYQFNTAIKLDSVEMEKIIRSKLLHQSVAGEWTYNGSVRNTVAQEVLY